MVSRPNVRNLIGEKPEMPSHILKILFQTISRYVVALPLFGLFFSVVWSVLFDFSRSTSTSCHVPNYLPSVSAAIALTPQAYIWRTCITLHIGPRYLVIYGYWIWYSSRPFYASSWLYPARKVLMLVTAFANFFELSALLGLTLISSRENKNIHEGCFVMFMMASMICMISACLVNYATVIKTHREVKSKQTKFIALIVNITAFVISLYFYFRHNYYCEPGVYTWFAICEYVVIISNMAFHYTISLDLADYALFVKRLDDDKTTAEKDE